MLSWTTHDDAASPLPRTEPSDRGLRQTQPGSMVHSATAWRHALDLGRLERRLTQLDDSLSCQATHPKHDTDAAHALTRPNYALNQRRRLAVSVVEQGYADEASRGWRSHHPPYDGSSTKQLVPGGAL